jgi:2,3-bisphosphoglycerate-dependent phosphoglycerate mutase
MRAIDTVADFAGEYRLPIEPIEDFREHETISDNYSDNDYFPFIEQYWADVNYKVDGDESFVDLQKRNIFALNKVITKYKNKNVVIATHGMALSSIINYYDNTYSFDDFLSMVKIKPWVVIMKFDGEHFVGMWKIDLFEPNKDSVIHTVFTPPLDTYKGYEVVGIFARYQNKWLYGRAKSRDVYEMIGGGVKDGETPLEAAKRELYEETGTIKYTMKPVCDYRGVSRTRLLNGQLFYAEIEELGEIPKEHEMAEVKLFDTIPDKMRFPELLPVLFEKARDFQSRSEYGN